MLNWENIQNVLIALFPILMLSIMLLGGMRNVFLRRKAVRVRKWIDAQQRRDSCWNRNELIAVARKRIEDFFATFNVGNDLELRKIVHPDAWDELGPDLLKLRNKKQGERLCFNFDIQNLQILHASHLVSPKALSLIVEVRLVGHYETWKASGLVRSRYSNVSEFWEFRTYMNEWRVIDRYGSVAWLKVAFKRLQEPTLNQYWSNK